MTIVYEVEFALIEMDLSPTLLGIAVAGNGRLVRQLKKGRKPRAPMIGRIRAYIAAARNSRGLAPVAPDNLGLAMERHLSQLRSVANNN
jgi:hypothetical protein